MNSFKKLCSVFVTVCIIKELQGQCTTAYGGQGQCKALNSCTPLFALVNKQNRNPQDIDVLRRSHCGFQGNSPAVCCPVNQPEPPQPQPQPSPDSQCTTPDSQPGRCIGLYSCAHITLWLQNKPVSQEVVQYVQNSRCNGPETYSVCCGPDSSATVQPTGDCQSSVSAFPPDPDTQCCGYDASFSDKIFGGTEAAIDQYPWLALIEYARNDGQIKLFCGGSLISGRYVLTAAHCVTGKVLDNNKPIRIRLGEHDTTHDGADCVSGDCNKGAISIPIERIIPHPEYNPTSVSRWNDIALIRMNRLAPFHDFIRPICLPKMDITLTADPSYNLTVAGWGAVSDNERRSSVKLYVDLPYVSRDRCQRTYGRGVPLWGGQLCAGGVQGKDSCKGDSGGPLMWESNRRNDLVGVVSFGHKVCGSNNIAAVYTNVYKYIPWIRSNIVA